MSKGHIIALVGALLSMAALLVWLRRPRFVSAPPHFSVKEDTCHE